VGGGSGGDELAVELVGGGGGGLDLAGVLHGRPLAAGVAGRWSSARASAGPPPIRCLGRASTVPFLVPVPPLPPSRPEAAAA
jgi:hypothetical protein